MTFDSDINWVIVRVKDEIFALDSTYVDAISLLEEDITHTPDEDPVKAGIVNFRGDVLSIIDLRALMGEQSVDEELQELQTMLDTRRNDHIKWVSELKRCAHDHTGFTMATDPHNCVFGKWFYSYKPKNQSVAFHLNKIEEPHRKLHESAIKVLAHSEKYDETTAQAILDKETEAYKTQVLNLLQQTKEAFTDNARKILIAISDSNYSCGILLDEVLAVEKLDVLPSDNMFTGVDVVSCVAKRRETSELVMILNMEKIWSHT